MKTVRDRMERKLQMEPTSGCWLWTGAADGHGYGHINIGGRFPAVHRVMYELERGPIPVGLVLDHLCRTPLCCNPDHLEPVTQRENLRRGFHWQAAKTHCKNGHALAGDNLFYIGTGRACRICERARKRRYRERMATR